MDRLIRQTLVVGAFVLAVGCDEQSSPDSGPLTISGRIECDETPIASKTPGRILSIVPREGDRVSAGDLLIKLSSEQAAARRDQAEAVLAAAEQELATARLRLPVIEEKRRQISLRVEQARRQASGVVAGADGALAAARADLSRAEAEWNQAKADAGRFTKLAKGGAVPKQAAELASTKSEAARALVEAAQKRVSSAQGGLQAAQAGSANPDILEAERLALEKQADEARGVISIAEAGVNAAQALMSQANAELDELEIRSPIDGFVITRSAEPGQVIPPGRTLLTLADPAGFYFRGFVAQAQVDRVGVGTAANVELDAVDEPIRAEVSRVDPEATFTPESVYFSYERARQAVGVKLRVLGADSRIKLGMTGQATLDVP